MMPGARPLVTISEIESNWKPKGLSDFKSLAIKPSKKSKKIPSKTKRAAFTNWSLIAEITAMDPHNKFREVIIFGTNFFNIALII